MSSGNKKGGRNAVIIYHWNGFDLDIVDSVQHKSKAGNYPDDAIIDQFKFSILCQARSETLDREDWKLRAGLGWGTKSRRPEK